MKKRNMFITLGLALGLGIGVAAGVGARREMAMAELAPFSGETSTVYLDVSNKWSTGARFAVYYYATAKGYEKNEAWTDMTQLGGSSIYKASVPNNATAIFCRMNGATVANNWDNKWNQSQDISDFSCGLFYVSDWDSLGAHYYNLRVNGSYVTGLKVDESNTAEVYAQITVAKGDAISIRYNDQDYDSGIYLGENDKPSNNIDSDKHVKHGGTFRFSMKRDGWTNAWLSGYDGGDATLEAFCNTLLTKTASCATANWGDVVTAWAAIKDTASGTTFKNQLPNLGDDVEYSSVVEEAKTRYSLMRTKYSVAALEGVSPTTATLATIDNNSNNNATLIIVVISSLVLLSVGGFFLLRKKREN